MFPVRHIVVKLKRSRETCQRGGARRRLVKPHVAARPYSPSSGLFRPQVAGEPHAPGMAAPASHLTHGIAHSELTKFFSAVLPLKPLDVSFLYHIPRHSAYATAKTPTDHVILSITPTTSVYDALRRVPRGSNPICFLHRPWALDRRALPRDTLVLASHKSFDENLTVGWNPPLAKRLGFAVHDEAMCVQGYKRDEERRIGLLGRSAEPAGFEMKDVLDKIKLEYDGCGALYGPTVPTYRVAVLAIMNAFHAEEVDRVVKMVQDVGWSSDPKSILYLTGQPRESGLEAARSLGVPVVCVGHRACEEWGIRYLGEELRKQYPHVQVQEVLEAEEPEPPCVAQD